MSRACCIVPKRTSAKPSLVAFAAARRSRGFARPAETCPAGSAALVDRSQRASRGAAMLRFPHRQFGVPVNAHKEHSMRKSRYQKGSVKKQRGRWVAMWWVDGSRKSRVIGLVKDMTKSEARAVVDGIVTEINAKRDQNRVWTFGAFVAEVYFPYYSRKWKESTRANNVNRVSVHLVRSFRGPGAFGLPARRAAGSARPEGAGWSFVLRRRSSAMGSQADFRYGASLKAISNAIRRCCCSRRAMRRSRRAA